MGGWVGAAGLRLGGWKPEAACAWGNENNKEATAVMVAVKATTATVTVAIAAESVQSHDQTGKN